MRLSIVAVVLTLVVVLIGVLTVRGAPLWTPDNRASRAFFNFGLDHPWLADVGDWFGTLTVPTVLRVIALVGAFLLWRRGDKATAVWFAATVVVVGAVAIAVRYAVGRPRPLWPGFGPPEPGLTFPSGHATSAAGFALCLVIVVWPRTGRRGRIAVAVLAAALAVGVAMSRVLVGVHRISDVVAAWALAGALVAASLAIASAVAARREQTSPVVQRVRT